MDKTQVMIKIGIVTGATGGLGHAFTQLLMENDDLQEVWVIGRNEDKLAGLKSEYGDKVRLWELDLTHPESFAKIKAELGKERKYDIVYLINCAGFGKMGDYSDTSLEESLEMIQLNCGAVVGMCLTCLPYMEAESHIINVSSQLSSLPTPYFALYGATKAFVKSYSRALNVETKKEKNIIVTTAVPEWMETEFLKTMQENNSSIIVPRYRNIRKPEDVAQKTMNDALNNKSLSIVGFPAKCRYFLFKILPNKWTMQAWMKELKLNKNK